MKKVGALNVKIFADGADFNSILSLSKESFIKGFTTNPSLMRKAGVSDYEKFARRLLKSVTDKPISFEIFADNFKDMEAQAREIASWGSNVYVKIPVTNTKGDFTGPLISKLSQDGIQLNITAIFTLDQVKKVASALSIDTPAVVSVFAGRVADTGVDPEPLMRESIEILKSKPKSELLWASVRELINIFQAERTGCHIITVPNELLAKLSLIGKSLSDYSLETVIAFYEDAVAAGYGITTKTDALV